MHLFVIYIYSFYLGLYLLLLRNNNNKKFTTFELKLLRQNNVIMIRYLLIIFIISVHIKKSRLFQIFPLKKYTN